MKNHPLSIIPLVFACIFPWVAKADPVPTPAPEVPEILTPARGTPERKAILDAVRPFVKDLTGRPEIIFVVEQLLVCDGWAWFHGLPQTPDGSAKFEDVNALVRLIDGRWQLARVLDIEWGEEDDPGAAWDRFWLDLKRDFPALPQALVDVARGCSQ